MYNMTGHLYSFQAPVFLFIMHTWLHTDATWFMWVHLPISMPYTKEVSDISVKSEYIEALQRCEHDSQSPVKVY